MCGIIGFWDSSFRLKSRLGFLAEQMCSSLYHRGPDASGFWNDLSSGIALGHRRLSVIDLSAAGHQPMRSESGRYIIVFNGEIYNYIELRQQLIKSGYEFKSNSDTEVILALYDLKKEECLKDLEGMFAFITPVITSTEVSVSALYHCMIFLPTSGVITNGSLSCNKPVLSFVQKAL